MREAVVDGIGNRGEKLLQQAGGEIKDVKLLAAGKAVVTPDTAVERIWSSLGQFYPNPVDRDRLLDSFNAPRKYTDSRGVERGFSFPKEFSLVLIESPYYGVTTHDEHVFSWCLGLKRTDHDPRAGVVNRYWGVLIPISTKPGNEKDLEKYPQEFKYYEGNEPTCWARFHLFFLKDCNPFVGLSSLQNEQLIPNAEVIKEFTELFEKSTGRWKEHYNKVRNLLGEGTASSRFFAYPNRSLLLPLVGLRMAEDLGVEAFAMAGRIDDAMPIYGQAMRFLRGCRTDVQTAFVADLSREEVAGELKAQCNFDLKSGKK
ncbi:MAG: hypothetical protein FJY77_01345 [Candidatus Altiarchaeales archaeon]|nr:hypothetical protein [Candidatus Altiarchaeales archaeon]